MKRENLKQKKEEIKERLKSFQEAKKKKMQEQKAERRERRGILIKSFISNLIHNKLYLLSLIITIIFFATLIGNELSEEVDKVKLSASSADEVIEPTIKIEKLTDELDIEPYIGIYSRTVNLSNEILLNSCSINSYKIIYHIEKSKKITKYYQSDCTGTITILTDTLSYYNAGGARYIGTKDINFIFGTNKMKEVDGETYQIDQDITKISEKKTDKNLELYFIDNNIIINTNDNLFLLKESTISFQIPNTYESIGGNLNKRVYKEDGYIFRFIIFHTGEQAACYDNIESEEPTYTIYQINYNRETKEFDEPKLLVARTKKDGCEVYKQDLETLKE